VHECKFAFAAISPVLVRNFSIFVFHILVGRAMIVPGSNESRTSTKGTLMGLFTGIASLITGLASALITPFINGPFTIAADWGTAIINGLFGLGH
jgi:hypothetical protein